MAISEREIAAWGTWLRAAGRPQTTIDLRSYHVRRVMKELDGDPWAATTETLVNYLGAQTWGPETRRSYRASLRGFYTWGQAMGRRPDNPALLIPPVRVPRRTPRPTPEPMYRQAVLDGDDRLRLMVQLAAICGLRRGEIAELRRENLDASATGFAMRVRGKGGHVRAVPLPVELAQTIARMPPGWLFPSTAPGGGCLTAAHVGKLISRALPEGWTCHTLRHRCATQALWGSNDLRAVQELLGHAKPETTMAYTLVRDDQIRRLINITAA